jgi:hypothetical protein
MNSMRWVTAILLMGGVAAAAPASVTAEEIVIYGFEGSPEGWAIPDWAKSSADYVGQECLVSQEKAGEGRSALEVRADFPGERWTGVYVEREVEVTDWTPFGTLAVDVYLPPTAPEGLQGKLILTVGEEWTWTEMNQTVPLAPGTWTTLSANLKPGSMDWKFFPDEKFRGNVRKVGVRIESDKAPVYRGSVFLDNIRLSE